VQERYSLPVAKPTSFRLPEELLAQLDEEAVSSKSSVTALVTSLLEEGLRTRRFPGIVYRDGPTGRRAGLVGGPDVWEVVRALKTIPGRPEQRVRALAEQLGLGTDRIRLAVDFYAAHPEEIDRSVVADEQATETVREVISRRERLLSS
jgi:hypothetical protein